MLEAPHETYEVVVSFKLFMSLFSAMFISIVGVYAWTYKISQDSNKKLSEIYDTVNRHIQKSEIHSHKSEFANAEVCKVIHESISKNLDEIKKHVKTLINKK